MIQNANSETPAASAGGGGHTNASRRRGVTRRLRAHITRDLARHCRIMQLARDLVPHLMEIATEAKIARDEAMETLDNTTAEAKSHETSH